MPTINFLSRRQFGKKVASIFAAAACFKTVRGATSEDPNAVDVFIDLQEKFTTPDEVASKFVRASSPFLMASYAVFFPEFLRQKGIGAVASIREAKEIQKLKYSKDHHRLDALPAVTAAHLLRVKGLDDDRKSELCAEIASALSSDGREIREIVLQNLITAAASNIDSFRFFAVDGGILEAISRLADAAEQNPKLLTPASLSAEFLLNASALLRKRDDAQRLRTSYDKLLDRLRSSVVPHLSYIGRLAEIHERTFTADCYDIESLPPQSSEALIGWKNLHDSRIYLEQLALLRAHLMYVNWETATGKRQSDEIMTAEEAQRALTKTIAFFRNFDLLPLLPSDIAAVTPREETGFRRFVTSELRQLVAHPEREGIDISNVRPSEEEVLLATEVPFTKYDDYGLLGVEGLNRAETDRKDFFSRILAGTSAVGGAALTHRKYDSIVDRIFAGGGVAGSQAEEAVDKVKERLSAIDERIESGQYRGLEEQEEELGPIPLPGEAEDES